MEYTLVIMAAGLGSRYGSLKQIDPVGPNGEFIIYYSVYDAIKAGFNKVVFIIRKEFYDDFKETIGKKLEGKIKVCYAFQELDDLPSSYVCPKDRVKPWGTGAAIYSARDMINGNFAVINADDFYGADAYKILFDYVKNNTNENEGLTVCYKASNTLSQNGSVKRGVALVSNGMLTNICESQIEGYDDHILVKPLDNSLEYKAPLDTLVTMNLFGFTNHIKDVIVNDFSSFLDENIDKANSEYLIPDVISKHISCGDFVFKVKDTSSLWHGITYKEDKADLVKVIDKYIDDGIYPNKLF